MMEMAIGIAKITLQYPPVKNSPSLIFMGFVGTGRAKRNTTKIPIVMRI